MAQTHPQINEKEVYVPSSCSSSRTCFYRSTPPRFKEARKAVKAFTTRKKELQRLGEYYRLKREGKKLGHRGWKLEAYISRGLTKFDAR